MKLRAVPFQTVPSCSRISTLLRICFITTTTSATIGMCKSLPVITQRILSNRIGSRQRNGKKQSCSFTASIARSVLRRMAYLYLMMSAIFHGYAAFLRCINRDARENNIADEDDNSPYPYHGKTETLSWARSLGWSKR